MLSLRKWTALAAVAALTLAPADASAPARRLVDRDGLEFVSSAAFCALHCRPWRVDASESQCDAARCPQFHTSDATQRRQLQSQGQVHSAAGQEDEQDEENDAKVSVLRCGDANVSFAIDAAATDGTVFQRLHTAFFRAFDAMVTSENASVEACELQWLQQTVLPNATAASSSASPSLGARPTLVRIDPLADQRACVESVKAIASDEAPLLSRLGQASATVMLVHVNASQVDQLSDLECVVRVVELPSILKLLPLARSASQLVPGATTPRMWVRVLKGSDPETVLTRLQTKLETMYGISNLFELPARREEFPRGLFIKPVAQLELWSHALAVAVADGEVEWVDAKSAVTVHGLKGTSYEHVQQRHRRLDEYVESLIGVEPAQQQGIKGDGVIVGITDTGLYMDHDQFDQDSRAIYTKKDMSARKVVYYYPWADQYDEGEDVTCGHGTHVSGLLAGSSFSGKNANIGIAPNARIAFMDIGAQSASCAGQQGCPVNLATPGEAGQLLNSQISVGAKIFSFSWGTGQSDYGSQARDLDAFIYENPEILIIVAAGNSGETSVNGQGTISSPSGAKNVISVGASLNAAESFVNYPCPNIFNPTSVASFSSAGPTTDGRMKPDVVAPGMTLVSARSEKPGSTVKTSETCSLQGTSQATPVVTGIAVLLSQWLRDGWWKTGKKDDQYAMKTVPAALLKALIVHSGDSLQRRLSRFPSGPVSCGTIEGMASTLSYPDVYQGYGKPNMSNIVDFSASATTTPTLYFLPNSTADSEPSVANGKEVRISFTVPKGVDLRATIAWTDPAGSVMTTVQLQHDLDLSVQIRNSSKVFYPLTADKTTKRDSRNNVEMVQVSYQELVDALKEDTNSTAVMGPSGEIIVDAIIYGRSVLQADAQSFAFVASSSVIGTTSGSSGPTSGKKGGSGGSSSDASSSPLDASFWSTWKIAAVAGGAFVLLLVISCIVSCCCRSRRRPPPPAMGHSTVVMPPPSGGAMYQPYQTPRRANLETCPYCAFSCDDAVVMVNHVENMHTDGGLVVNGPGTGSFARPPMRSSSSNEYAYQFQSQYQQPPPYQHQAPYQQLPSYPQYHDHQHVGAPVGYNVTGAREDERCPFCTFTSGDAVILVNHVENFHGDHRIV